MENYLRSSGIDFDWKILPGRTSLEMLRKVQEDVQSRNFDPETFGDRIIFMSTFNDIDWNKRHNEEECLSNSEHNRDHMKRFSQGHSTFLGLGDEAKWYRNRIFKPEGE